MKTKEINLGLSEKVTDLLLETFASHPKIIRVLIFGSRAKGNYHTGSDIDLAVVAPGITYDQFQKLRLAIDNLELLYKVDILDFNKIDNQGLIDHINQVGKIFYES